MKILAIPASNSRNGINRQLIGYAARLFEDGLVADAEIDIVDLNDYELPIYSQEREANDGVPAQARQLFEKIGAADAVVVSFAEHNGSYAVAWKNTYDWMSRIDMGVYQGKPVAMFAASPGPRGGAGVLGSATTTAPFFGAELVGSLGVPTFQDNFDPAVGEITDADLRARFIDTLEALAGT